MQKYEDDCDIVHHAAILARPPFVGQLHQGIDPLLYLVLLVIREDHSGRLLVVDELPQSIRAHDDELILLLDLVVKYLRLASNTYTL